MLEHRLLDRLRMMAKNPDRRMTEDPNQMVRSVQEHLERILNTRIGNVPIADDYGIPDFTNLISGYYESKQSVERTIRNTIMKYEPRLQLVRVAFLEQEDERLTLRFQISAQLKQGDNKDPVMFESVLDAGGHIEVKQ